MNASRLREIVDLLLQRESEHNIQGILGEVASHLSNLAGAPQEQSHQTGFADALQRLGASMSDMVATFEPAQLELIKEIGADAYFSLDIRGVIEQSVRENPITPTVTRDYLSKLVHERQLFLDEITRLQTSLETLRIEASELDAGTAELGFLIPRDLFDNQFEHLIKRLEAILFIIRTFAEAATGSAPEIKVRQISGSDPLFFFGLDPVTIQWIAGTVSWSLITWKQVADIRKVRAETKRLKAFTEADLALFDDKIKKTIEAETKKKVGELLKKADKSTGRTKEEQRTYLTRAAETVLALVERGLQVEIRALPPAPPEGAEEDQDAALPPEFARLEEIIPQLVFPLMEGTPLLILPSPRPYERPPEPEVETTKPAAKPATKKAKPAAKKAKPAAKKAKPATKKAKPAAKKAKPAAKKAKPAAKKAKPAAKKKSRKA